MGVRDDQLQRRVGWPIGLNNLAPETKLPVDENGVTLALREADNLDFDPSGRPRTRRGRTLLLAGETHSAWSHAQLDFGLFVDGDRLLALFPGARTEELVSGLARGAPVSYDLFHDTVLWTNGAQSGAIGPDLVPMPWSCSAPSGRPDATGVAGGALDAGRYQVAVTFIDQRGRESGGTRAVVVDVPANGAIELTNIPQPADALDVPIIQLYATHANSKTLRVALRLASGTTTARLVAAARGRAVETLLLHPMPGGHIVRAFNGRQLVARENELLYSPAFRAGQFDERARVIFQGRITLLQPVADGTEAAGVFVADAARTYFLPGGDPANWRQIVAYPYGAVPGSPALGAGKLWGLDTGQLLPVWMATNGRLCVGQPGGGVYLPQPRDGGPDAIADQAQRAALLLREQDGGQQVVAALQGARPNPTALAFKDQLIGRVYEHIDADPG